MENIKYTKDNTVKFTVAGTYYTRNEKGNRFFREDEGGRKVRISKSEWEMAWDDFMAEVEMEQFEEEIRKSDESAENAVNHPKKSKKSKNAVATFSINGIEISLTEKQVEFIKLFPGCDYAEDGYNSGVWVFAVMDHMTSSAGSFFEKPMTVGAIISTLREKGLIYVAIGEGRTKKDSRYISFTELGLAVVDQIA